MFPDYQAQVLLSYHKKREAGGLSLNLLRPTPAKLREECLATLRDRYVKKDEKVLKMFFEPKSNEVDYAQLIRKFDADKFRPLVNFLKGKTDVPEDKNIELLAWLLDFEPRPYQFLPGEPVTVQKPVEIEKEKPKELTAEAKSVMLAVTPNGPETTATKSLISSNTRSKNAVILTVILIVIGASGYIFWTTNKPTTAHSFTFKQSGGCMYWSADHYEPVPCDQKINAGLVLALDTLKLTHFKLIKENDTVSPNSVRKVWYFKTPKGLELYTDSGFHPVHVERRLKPLTRYMWDTYLSSK